MSLAQQARQNRIKATMQPTTDVLMLTDEVRDRQAEWTTSSESSRLMDSWYLMGQAVWR